MICPRPLELQSYFDEELSPRRMRAIKKHLEDCEHCRGQIGEWNRLLHQMRQILTPVDTVKVDGGVNRQIFRKHWKLIAAAAVIVITIGFSAVLVLNGLGHRGDIGHSLRMQEDNRDTELMKEYFILHQEESNSYGGSDV